MNRLWPLPALLAWAASWVVFSALLGTGVPAGVALLIAAAPAVALAVQASTPWRRVFVAVGFPLSLAASGAATLPAWAWLLPLLALVLLYPVGAWRDAPVFPTPAGALRGLGGRLGLPAGARVLDAGCGLGDALVELHREFPNAALAGVERSAPLALIAALRCRFALVRRADMWAADWSAFACVYVFQRPESMARVAAKAVAELEPGAWLASLEFEIAAWPASAVFRCADGRPLWLYRLPDRSPATS